MTAMAASFARIGRNASGYHRVGGGAVTAITRVNA